jgi:tetratricopeptide (TPR) repeat protein
MSSRVVIVLFASVTLLAMGVYFLVNPSYEKSLKAKYYYEIGEYEQALVLSKEAFSIDQYNRMAATVIAQSITSLKYVKYIQMGQEYIVEIDKIASHEYISDADKAKIRLMCEVMLSSYIKLAPSVVTDKKLIEESAAYYKKFENLLEKVNRKI